MNAVKEIIRLAPGEPCPEADTGDFLLIRGEGPLSSAMKFVLQYTHVVSFTAYPEAADAQARGVIPRGVAVYENTRRVLVRVDASERDRAQMLAFLESVLDRKYSYNYIGFFVTGLMILTGGKLSVRRYNTSYCSGLEAETLTRAGYIFDRPPSSVSPDDLARHVGVIRAD